MEPGGIGGCLTQTSSSTLVMLSSREFFSDSLSLSSSSIPAKATFLVPGDTPALLMVPVPPFSGPPRLSELEDLARSLKLPFFLSLLRELAPGELVHEVGSSPPTRSGAEPGLRMDLSAQVRSIFTAPDLGVRFFTVFTASFTVS